MDNNTVIEVQNLSHSYHGVSPVLNKISFQVNAGDYIGIIGENGSGKTTLIKLILGGLKIQTGEIKLFGKHVSSFNQWSKIGYIPQNGLSMMNHLPATVLEVVTSGLTGYGINRKEKNDLIEQVLINFDLQNTQNRLVSELSGGQRQRVMLARSLVHNPSLILLDEPTSGLDETSRESLFLLLKHLQLQGKTIIIISHDHERINHEADRLLCIQNCDGLERNLHNTQHFH